jgi:hypothetical protein
VAEALRDHFHRHAVGEQQGGVGVAEVVQPDRGEQVLPQRLAGLGDLAGEAAGEPLRVPVGAVEGAELVV